MSTINPYLRCPNCGSDDMMKNGTTRRGKQNHQCRDCGRQFVENSQWQRREPDTTATIDRLLLEQIPLAGIARVLKVSESWLQADVNQCYKVVPRQPSAGVPQTQRCVQRTDGRIVVFCR